MRQRRCLEKAIRIAKERDNHKCQRPGCIYLSVMHGAHLLVRNSPFPRFNAANPDFIITLCMMHHLEYDRNHGAAGKIDWLMRNGLSQYADRLRWIIGELEETA